MALLKEEQLGDALLLIYGAAAVAIPGLGHLWRGIRVCIGSEGWPGLTAVSPTRLYPAARASGGDLMEVGFNSPPASA